MKSFSSDPFPGEPRILFVGLSESTHTHSWIDLLSDSGLNVRLFAMPSGMPPASYKVRTYVSAIKARRTDPEWTVRLFPQNRYLRTAKRGLSRQFLGGERRLQERWLAQVLARWKPHVVHTLGLDPAGVFYSRVLRQFPLPNRATWVLQLRGGSDLALSRLDPEKKQGLELVLQACDQIISDNERNFRYAKDLGAVERQFSGLGLVPGTGGIHVTRIGGQRDRPPSQRETIVWPKAYEAAWSKAMPVLEALKISWARIEPVEIYMLAATPDVKMWFWDLPEAMRRKCHILDRIPHEDSLRLMTESRVMLAPSLVDGVPNSMFEAMAAGAFPIVSPLTTIKERVKDEENVLFARNLYPEEIAAALTRAMNDDELVDKAAVRNLELVRDIADRAKIGPKVIEYYRKLAN